MEISGKQSTKSYGTQLSVARKQQNHMIRGGKKSTKLYGTQWQENNSHMIRSGKNSTKLCGTQWQENNKVIRLAAESQRSHLTCA